MSQDNPFNDDPLDIEKDFPLHDLVEDYLGNQRPFTICCHATGIGFRLIAEEDGKDGLGYQFSAYSETSPFNALFHLRGKMHRLLSMRHITTSAGRYSPLHNKLIGRITYKEGPGIVYIIDGIMLTGDDLAEIFSMHEGWQFSIEFADFSEDISK